MGSAQSCACLLKRPEFQSAKLGIKIAINIESLEIQVWRGEIT